MAGLEDEDWFRALAQGKIWLKALLFLFLTTNPEMARQWNSLLKK
jgi:hypothetical protein